MRNLLVLVLIFSSMSAYSVTQEYIDNAFKEAAEKTGVRERLLRAICWVESNHKPYEYNHGDSNQTDHAFGVCQILYSTAHSLGLVDPKCLGDFQDVSYADRIYKNCKLFGPKTNILYAAKFLKKKIEQEGNEFRAISAYNLGRYKECRDGWLYYKGERFKPCIIGGPANLYYIKKVDNALKKKR